MRISPFRTVVLIALIPLAGAACDPTGTDPIPGDCGLTSVASAPDTAFAATVGGRTVLIPSSVSTPLGGIDTTTDLISFEARTYQPGKEEEFVFMLDYQGPGAYPLQETEGYPGWAVGAYWCEGAAAGNWSTRPVEGDTMWITSYDTVTGLLKGTFQFHGVFITGNTITTDTLQVSEGSFTVPLARGGPAATRSFVRPSSR